jgi:hypothetical protein
MPWLKHAAYHHRVDYWAKTGISGVVEAAVTSLPNVKTAPCLQIGVIEIGGGLLATLAPDAHASNTARDDPPFPPNDNRTNPASSGKADVF